LAEQPVLKLSCTQFHTKAPGGKDHTMADVEMNDAALSASKKADAADLKGPEGKKKFEVKKVN
jgi:hypothetical protein